MFGWILLALVAAGGLAAAAAKPEGERLAVINHAIHIARDLECVDCHLGVRSHAAAGVPSVTICAECHDDPEDGIAQTENGQRILDHILRGEELWWPKLYHLPDHVGFSHRRHAELGGIACDECHGDIAAATDCRTCHTVIPHLDDGGNCRRCQR
jgi:hypothetical protein